MSSSNDAIHIAHGDDIAMTSSLAGALLVRMLMAHGIRTHEIQHMIRMNPDQLLGGYTTYPQTSLLTLFSIAEKKLNLPHIGLILHRQFLQAEMPVVLQICIQATTLRKALLLMQRSARLLGNHEHVSVEIAEELTTISYKNSTINRNERWLREHYFATTIMVLQRFFLPNNGLLRVEFEHDDPNYPAEYQRIFRCPIHFSCETNRVIFRSDMLDLSSTASNPFFLTWLDQNQSDTEAILRFSAPPQLSWYDSVRLLLLRSLLLNEKIAFEQVAQKLNVSTATLKRYLSAEGVNFRKIIEVVRTYIETLPDSSQKKKNIATMLGYKDTSGLLRRRKKNSKID